MMSQTILTVVCVREIIVTITCFYFCLLLNLLGCVENVVKLSWNDKSVTAANQFTYRVLFMIIIIIITINYKIKVILNENVTGALNIVCNI